MPGVCARPKTPVGPRLCGEGVSIGVVLGRLPIGDKYTMRDLAGLAELHNNHASELDDLSYEDLSCDGLSYYKDTGASSNKGR